MNCSCSHFIEAIHCRFMSENKCKIRLKACLLELVPNNIFIQQCHTLQYSLIIGIYIQDKDNIWGLSSPMTKHLYLNIEYKSL